MNNSTPNTPPSTYIAVYDHESYKNEDSFNTQSGIYYIYDHVNHAGYIGKTSVSFKSRWHNHMVTDYQTTYFQNKLRAHPEFFKFYIIAISDENLSELELQYITEYKTYKETGGYNIAIGGDGGQRARYINEVGTPYIDIARKNNISDSTYYGRVASGMSHHDACTIPAKDHTKYIHKSGKPYVMIAKENGITAGTFQNRINSGWSPDDASSLSDGKTKYVSDYGTNYVQLALKNGISKRMFYGRVKSGMNLDDASSLPNLVHTHYRSDGVPYCNIAKENGISVSLFNVRISNGWDPDRASSEPKTDPIYVDSNGNSLLKIAESNGIKKSTFYMRIKKRGMSPLDAATIPVRREGVKPDDPV